MAGSKTVEILPDPGGMLVVVTAEAELTGMEGDAVDATVEVVSVTPFWSQTPTTASTASTMDCQISNGSLKWSWVSRDGIRKEVESNEENILGRRPTLKVGSGASSLDLGLEVCEEIAVLA